VQLRSLGAIERAAVPPNDARKASGSGAAGRNAADLNGIDICRQIKADALLDTFVVLVSGKAISAADKVGGAETGADDYIVKPVNPDEFLARIRTIVRLRETTAALRASEQHYRRLVEILPDAVGMMDLQGRLTTANRQAVEMLGYAGRRSCWEKVPST